jgi:hypothetical protein
MHPAPFQEDARQNILHVRGFRYDRVEKLLSTQSSRTTQLADLMRSMRSRSLNLEKTTKIIAYTLVEPSLAVAHMEANYFSTEELLLYTKILFCYSCITPGLRICDMEPYWGDTYEQSGITWETSIANLAQFESLVPQGLRPSKFTYLSRKISKSLDQHERFKQYLYLANHTLASGRLGLTLSQELFLTDELAAVDIRDEIWVVFGCPTPMVLRHHAQHFLVVSPVYIRPVMKAQAVRGVVNRDTFDPYTQGIKAWSFRHRDLKPYISGQRGWTIQDITLC